ncbi:threonine synthase [Candidatus Bipolaricaulota bacterium]|nr:threonine synthase [Candidatus Bipolaricaulota bacterium]
MRGRLVCPFCRHVQEPTPQPEPCPRCQVPLRYELPPSTVSWRGLAGRGVWRYRPFLPSVAPVSLGEGGTPLIPSSRLGPQLGARLHFKLEGANPTGSFKDRGASVLVSVLAAFGARRVADDSSGNAGAALAAYAARAGLAAVLFVPTHASTKKLAQIQAYGAELVTVPGPRPQATAAAKEACQNSTDLLYASHNESPYFEVGLRTVAYELAEELSGEPPDHVLVPVGGGGLFLGLVRGFLELADLGLISNVPRVHAVQAEACAPIVRAWEQGLAAPEPVCPGKTVAEGVCIPLPPRGREILATLREVKGVALAVAEEEIEAAWRELPVREGIYVEPTSAVAVAGLRRLCAAGVIEPGERVVVVLTGTGLKHSPAGSGD